jgi:hypothetical protein
VAKEGGLTARREGGSMAVLTWRSIISTPREEELNRVVLFLFINSLKGYQKSWIKLT